jgi:drug/metabolite transporter (DMT)-like permease
MSDSGRTSLGGWIAALGGAGIVVGAVFLVQGDFDWRLGLSFGVGFLLLLLGGVVMGSAGEAHRRRSLNRWGYVAGLSQGGWGAERDKKPDE